MQGESSHAEGNHGQQDQKNDRPGLHSEWLEFVESLATPL